MQLDTLWQFMQVDMETDRFEAKMRQSANRQKLIKQRDFLKDQPDHLIPHLEENKIPYELHIYGSEDNVLGHVFHVNVRLKDATLCNDEECEFFRKYMK